MFERRGQVTIFIIVGIIILAFSGAILLFRSYISSEQTEMPSGSTFAIPVEDFIQTCLDSVGTDALLFIGQHGGYYELPAVADSQLGLPYYFLQNVTYLPSLNDISKQLSLYVDHELSFCLRNFDSFRSKGLLINSSEFKTTSLISNLSVEFRLDFPITVQKGSVETSLNEFSVLVSSRLGVIYNVINQFVVEEQNHSTDICVSCLTDLVDANGLRAEMTLQENNTLIFSINDRKSSYEYRYLAEYHFPVVEENGVDIGEIVLEDSLNETTAEITE